MREMKDSGIEWIGKIPCEWNVHPVYYFFDERKNLNHLAKEQNLLSLSYGRVVRKNINATGGLLPTSFNTYNIVEAGDIIIRPTDLQNDKRSLRTGLVTEHGIITSAYIALKAKPNVAPSYFHYLLHAIDIQKVFYNMGNGVRQGLNYSEFSKLILVAPPLKEQKAIADFLDAKCEEIDRLTADIQSQIDNLEQYKRSLILETVTKGLDPNVPMKDTGLKWLGKIPCKWNVHPVYYFFDERKNINHLAKEQNLLSLSYGRVVRKNINATDGLLPTSFNTYNIVEAGDIIIRPTDLQNDKRSLRTGLVTEHGIITSAYIALKAKPNVAPSYFHYLLHAIDIQKVFYNMGNGVRQGLNYSEFSKLILVAPPLKEQQAIADFLDAKCQEIDEVVATKREQLNVLADYKKALIFEYVTGKKEVACHKVS